jgi:hypothetical protein
VLFAIPGQCSTDTFPPAENDGVEETFPLSTQLYWFQTQETSFFNKLQRAFTVYNGFAL